MVDFFCNQAVVFFCDVETDFISTMMNYRFRMITVLRRECCYVLAPKRMGNAFHGETFSMGLNM